MENIKAGMADQEAFPNITISVGDLFIDKDHRKCVAIAICPEEGYPNGAIQAHKVICGAKDRETIEWLGGTTKRRDIITLEGTNWSNRILTQAYQRGLEMLKFDPDTVVSLTESFLNRLNTGARSVILR